MRKRLGCGIEDFLQPRLQPKELVTGKWVPKEPAVWSRKLVKALHNLVWHNVRKAEVNDKLAARIKRRMKDEGTVGGDMAVRWREVYDVTGAFVGMGRKPESLED